MGQLATGHRSEERCCIARTTYCGESVVRLVRADEGGHRTSTRPVRSPTAPHTRTSAGTSMCWREKMACCACNNLVRFWKI